MTGRKRIMAAWQARLVYWQARLQADRPLRPWLAQAYVRVLSFMLARYGSRQEGASREPESGEHDAQADRLDSDVSRMAFYQASAAGWGKPARGGREIRGVLELVRQNQPVREQAGPLAHGLAQDEWIALAAFYDPAEIERLEEMLKYAQIEVRTQSMRRMTQALVRVADRERAEPIVAEHARGACDTVLWRQQREGAWAHRFARWDAIACPERRAIDWMRVGGVSGAALGATLFVISVRVAAGAPLALQAYLFAALFAAMLGYLAGAALGYLGGKIAGG
jgi:hypothetical protein